MVLKVVTMAEMILYLGGNLQRLITGPQGLEVWRQTEKPGLALVAAGHPRLIHPLTTPRGRSRATFAARLARSHTSATSSTSL